MSIDARDSRGDLEGVRSRNATANSSLKRMYGDNAIKLVQDSKRTLGLDHLPPYQTELVRAVLREVKALETEQQAILDEHGGASNFAHTQHPEAAVKILVQHLSKQRNKRCLMAYHKLRTDRLEELCWSDGLNRAKNDKETDALAPEELEYARRYNELLAAYKGQWTDIDLTGSLDPPKDLYIDVRVLKDAGEIQTEYGYGECSTTLTFQVDYLDKEQFLLCEGLRC